MWPGSFILIVINAFIFLVHSLPPNIDRDTLRNNSDPVVHNERILKLFLQLATHTANRLTHLRKETSKGYNCNRGNDNPSVSTTEALVTQLSLQANSEWLDERQKLPTHLSGDSKINSNQNKTALHSQLEESFDLSNLQNINDQNVARDSKMSVIPKSAQDVQDTLSDVTGYHREVLNSDILHTPILDLDTASNLQNASEFGLNSPKSASNSVNEKTLDQIALAKNIANTTIMNDLTKTVNKFLPNSQESTHEISQRLFGADLAQIVPKIINDVHGYANRHIPSQNTREPSNRLDDVSRKIFDTIHNSRNILNPRTAGNLPVGNQILSSTKNVVESIVQVLPEAAKGAGNLLHQIIPKAQDIINTPLKEEDQKPGHFGYTQQEQSKNVKQTKNQFDNQLHNRQDLTDNLGDNIRETDNSSGRDNQETRAGNLPINQNNLTAEDSNKQHAPALLSDFSAPLPRFLPDLYEQVTSNKTETDLSSVQTNENLNNSTDENPSINYKETDKSVDQIDGEMEAGGYKKINETGTDYGDEQLNPISGNSAQRSKESGSTDAAVATSASLDQLESSAFALTSITERQVISSSDAQDSENASNVTKADAEEERELQDNPSTNNEINRSTESRITHVDDKLLESNGRSLIDDLIGEDSHEQLSEAKLQEISDRLTNALQPYIEKRMDNNRRD